MYRLFIIDSNIPYVEFFELTSKKTLFFPNQLHLHENADYTKVVKHMIAICNCSEYIVKHNF